MNNETNICIANSIKQNVDLMYLEAVKSDKSMRYTLATHYGIITEIINDFIAKNINQDDYALPDKDKPSRLSNTDHNKVEKAFTSKQVANLLGVTVQALRHHVRVGHIVRISNGKYSAESVRTFLAGRSAK